MKRSSPFFSPRALLVAALLVPPVLFIWVAFNSGISELFRPDPSRDPTHLRGRALPLAGNDPFHPGQRFDLASLHGKPVLVCRMMLKSGHWIVPVLQRLLLDPRNQFVPVAVFTPQDEDPAAWVLHDGLVPFSGVVIDEATRDAWGFGGYTSQLRLVDAQGVIVSEDLVGEDRDGTAGWILDALKTLPPTP